MTDAPPNRLTRIAQISMIVNAILHSVGSLGMALGFAPHAAEQALMGRRAAAAGFAAIVMFVFVSRRLRRDPALVALPLAFVFCQLTATVVDFLTSHEASALAPIVPETIFLSIYCAFATTVLRKQHS
jgi:hypothetical protein